MCVDKRFNKYILRRSSVLAAGLDDIARRLPLIDKCVWTKDSINIYCAVPQSWPPDSMTLPDDYYKNTFLTTDDIWEINTETSEKNLILQGAGDILSLGVNSNNTSLILTSKNSRFLYQLNLK